MATSKVSPAISITSKKRIARSRSTPPQSSKPCGRFTTQRLWRMSWRAVRIKHKILEPGIRRGCSPPGTGGVDAPSIKCREASFERRGRGGQFREQCCENACAKLFVETDHPVCASKGGFATFYYSRSLPSCSRRGTPSPDDLRSLKKLVQKTKFYTLVT